KKEVNLYIKELIKKKDEEIEERLSKEVAALKKGEGGGESSKKTADLINELEAERAKVSKLETRCANMQTNLDRVTDELEKVKSAGGGGGGDAKATKAAKAEAENIIRDAKNQAAEIVENAKKKAKSAKSGGGGDPKAFDAVLARLDECKRKFDENYFAVSSLFEAAVQAAKGGASAATETGEYKSADAPQSVASDEFGEFADFAVDSKPSGGVSDEFAEFADFAVGGDSGVDDALSEFSELTLDGGGGIDDLSEFSEFTLDGGVSEPTPAQSGKKSAKTAKQPDDDILTDEAPPLVKTDNKGEFSEEFQDLMLSPTEKSVKGENLTEKDVAKKHDRGADLDESLFEMMLSHDVGALTATQNDDGGYSLTEMKSKNAGDIQISSSRAPEPPARSGKNSVNLPPDPQDTMWNFDIDEEAEEEDDMTSDNVEISDLLL
ncbi:MAG: hypothetical protein LBI36_05120, partial [Oscillospiraceae bacterium]|nr:hypothetical protein [Oscillospiraceae bacterium]